MVQNFLCLVRHTIRNPDGSPRINGSGKQDTWVALYESNSERAKVDQIAYQRSTFVDLSYFKYWEGQSIRDLAAMFKGFHQSFIRLDNTALRLTDIPQATHPYGNGWLD